MSLFMVPAVFAVGAFIVNRFGGDGPFASKKTSVMLLSSMSIIFGLLALWVIHPHLLAFVVITVLFGVPNLLGPPSHPIRN